MVVYSYKEDNNKHCKLEYNIENDGSVDVHGVSPHGAKQSSDSCDQYAQTILDNVSGMRWSPPPPDPIGICIMPRPSAPYIAPRAPWASELQKLSKSTNNRSW